MARANRASSSGSVRFSIATNVTDLPFTFGGLRLGHQPLHHGFAGQETVGETGDGLDARDPRLRANGKGHVEGRLGADCSESVEAGTTSTKS